jgi:bacillithiol biosynthesis cysteine-adding enzyme BshC
VSPPDARIETLPERWFDREQYRPQLPSAEGLRWFVLTGAVKPARTLHEITPPRSTAGDRPQRLASPAEVAAAFAATYAGWGIVPSDAAQRNLDALQDPRTRVVVTAQQPGFLGGPLFTLYKALSAVALSVAIERRLGSRCVPVFWVAGDDHDVDEARTARWPGADGAEVELSLPHPADRRPLSTLAVDADTEAVLDQARQHLAPRRFGAEAAALADLYRGRTVASGFAALLAAVLGGDGLLVLNPEELRPLARPLVHRVVESPEAAIEAIDAGAEELRSHGLKPFVATRLPLFLLRDGRRDHLSPAPGGLSVDGGGPFLDRSLLLHTLERQPQLFSAGALLRPLVQDSLLPVAAAVLGPTELGYHAQLGPLRRWLGVEAPPAVLRLQATFLGGREARAFSRLGLTAEGFAAARRPEDLLPRAQESTISQELSALRGRIEELGNRVADEHAAERRAVQRSTAAALAALDGLRARAERAAQRADADLTAAAEAVWRAAFPGGVLQERRWSWLHYFAKYGREWLGLLLRELEGGPASVCHRLCVLGAQAEHD